MTHYDEHTLELFVLDDEGIQRQKTLIEEHLKTCEGCSELAGTIASFYNQANKEIDATPVLKPHPEKALAARREDLVKMYEDLRPRVIVKKSSLPQKMYLFTRRNPVMTGAGLLGTALLMLFSFPWKSIDNPTHVYPNDRNNTLEVYGAASNEMLWELKWWSPENRAISRISDYGDSTWVLTDLKNDGHKSIVSCVMDLGEKSGETAVVRVFESREKFVKKPFNRSVRYNGVMLGDSFEQASGLLVEEGEHGQKEIYVLYGHRQSPCVLVRYDADLNVLGEYWHNGHFFALRSMDINGDGRNEIVLLGMNSDLRKATVSILDGRKIQGLTESTLSDGFRYQKSNAELYYIAFPDVGIESALELKPRMVHGYMGEKNILLIWSGRDPMAQNPPMLDYVFSADLQSVDVVMTDAMRAANNQLVRMGKGALQIGLRNLDRLRDGIQFWDGQKWHKEAVRVRPE